MKRQLRRTDIALQAQAMDEFYQQYPILLTPTTAATAPSIDNPLLNQNMQHRWKN